MRSMAFTTLIFTKLTDAQRHYMHTSYTEFHTDLIIIAGSMEIHQFTTPCEVWLSLNQFSRNSDAQRYYMHTSYTEFHPDLLTTAGSMEIYQFTTLREVWISLHQFSRNSKPLHGTAWKSLIPNFQCVKKHGQHRQKLIYSLQKRLTPN